MRRVKCTQEKRYLQLRTKIAVFTLLLLLSSVLLGNSLNNIRHSQASGKSPAYKYYTSIKIQEGDTLWEIADSYLGAETSRHKSEYIEEIKRLNKIDENEIRSGEYLLIPYYSDEYL